MRTVVQIALLALALLAPAHVALAEDREGSVTGKDLAERTLTIAGSTFAVSAETRLEDYDGVRITLAQFPVADSAEAGDGKGEAIVSAVYEASGQTLLRVRMVATGG